MEAEVHPRRRRPRQGVLHPRPRGRRALRPADRLLQRRRTRPRRTRHRRTGAQQRPHAARRRLHAGPARDRRDREGRSGPGAGGEAPRRHAADRARRGDERSAGAGVVDGGAGLPRGEGRGAVRRASQPRARQRPLPREDRHHRRPGRRSGRLDRKPERDRGRVAAQLGDDQRLQELGTGAGPRRRGREKLREPLGEPSEPGDRDRRPRGSAPRSAAVHAGRRHAEAVEASGPGPVHDRAKPHGRIDHPVA